MPDSSWANATLDPGYPIASASAVLAIPVASLISPDAARWDMTRSRVPTARSLLPDFIASRLHGHQTHVPHVSAPLPAAIIRVNALRTAIMPDRWLTLFIIVRRESQPRMAPPLPGQRAIAARRIRSPCPHWRDPGRARPGSAGRRR